MELNMMNFLRRYWAVVFFAVVGLFCVGMAWQADLFTAGEWGIPQKLRAATLLFNVALAYTAWLMMRELLEGRSAVAWHTMLVTLPAISLVHTVVIDQVIGFPSRLTYYWASALQSGGGQLMVVMLLFGSGFSKYMEWSSRRKIDAAKPIDAS
jgi:hypothetical protein